VKLSIIIPTHDTRELALRAVGSVLAQADPAESELLVVDDGGTDGTDAAVRAAAPSAVLLRHDSARGFSAAANAGLAAARGEVMLLLNSDAELLPGALAALWLAFEQNPRLGVAGARLFYADGRPQWSGGRLPTLPWLFALASGLGGGLRRLAGRRQGAAGHGERVDWVSGAALALRRAVYARCGPLDESYAFYCQDLDLCWCARRNDFAISIVSGFDVLHQHGATIARDGGTASQRSDLLWPDLVRCVAKYRGAGAGENARRALRWGAGLRLAGRRLGERWASDRETHRRTTHSIAAALAALSGSGRRAAPPC
jgi:GT2 family glycosyltransferase